MVGCVHGIQKRPERKISPTAPDVGREYLTHASTNNRKRGKRFGCSSKRHTPYIAAPPRQSLKLLLERPAGDSSMMPCACAYSRGTRASSFAHREMEPAVV